MEEKILNFEEVSNFLKIPKSTLYKLCQRKKIPYFKIGKQLRFRYSSLNQWLSEKEGRLFFEENKIKQEPCARLKHILLIDDDLLVLKTVSNFLRRNGYCVDEANSAQEALEKIEKLRFDLLVTDVKMPGTDGIEAIKRIRKFNYDYQRPQIPEIVISGFIDAQAQHHAESLGISHYLYKPFSIADLIGAVNSQLDPDAEKK